MHPNAHSGGPRAPAACPSCDSPFDAELSICPHCGALVPVETAVNEAVLRARRLFDRVWAGLPKSGLTRVNVLWLLALFPMVVVPAVFAAAGAGLLLGRTTLRHRLKPDEPAQLHLILAVALINLAVSLYLWDAFGDFALDRARALLDAWFDHLPLPGRVRDA